jgi:hypothetical protein
MAAVSDEEYPYVPECEARSYIEEHRILELFTFLGARIVEKRPDDVKQFLIDQLSGLKDGSISGGMVTLVFLILQSEYFSSSEIAAIFGSLSGDCEVISGDVARGSLHTICTPGRREGLLANLSIPPQVNLPTFIKLYSKTL